MYAPCIVGRACICQTIMFFDESRGGKRALMSGSGKGEYQHVINTFFMEIDSIVDAP